MGPAWPRRGRSAAAAGLFGGLAAVVGAVVGSTAVLGDDFRVTAGTGGSGGATGGQGGLGGQGGQGGVVPPVGEHVWSLRFGDAGAQSIHAVAVTPFGDVIVVGPLTSAGDFDAFAVKLG